MLFIALALAASDLPPQQILGGRPFESFAAATERRCPKKQYRSITPADLGFLQQGFEAQLPRSGIRQLNANSRVAARCKARGGLSCQVGETLDAYRRSGMLVAFSTYVCTRNRP